MKFAAKIIRGGAVVYAIASIIALLLVPASLYSWFGIAPDPLSGVYAYLLSLPWIMALLPFDEVDTWAALAAAAAGMGLNFWLLRRLARAVSR
ncbi:MAG: hypothetical protein ACTS1X_10160 [Parasphingopyxis sp.]|uniref:hypothetical protein n=1 Tax=Parasphingopyxis sp. TaxID=1920299 RepID=UPI003F9F229D